MTDEPQTEPAAEDVVDTTDGNRDPLSTDDGLAEISATMPSVPDDRPVLEDADPSEHPGIPLDDQEGMDVAEDGSDPLAEYATEED
jgi:hypothetical protein